MANTDILRTQFTSMRGQAIITQEGKLGIVLLGNKHATVLDPGESLELYDFLLQHVEEIKRRAGKPEREQQL